MPIAHQVRDPIQTDINLIAFRLSTLRSRLATSTSKRPAQRVMKGVGMSFGQLAQELQVFTPLRFCDLCKRVGHGQLLARFLWGHASLAAFVSSDVNDMAGSD